MDNNTYKSGEKVTVLSAEGIYHKLIDGTTDKHMTFVGWNTKADGSGTAYAPGAQILISDSDVTLYAQYEDQNPAEPTTESTEPSSSGKPTNPSTQADSLGAEESKTDSTSAKVSPTGDKSNVGSLGDCGKSVAGGRICAYRAETEAS